MKNLLLAIVMLLAACGKIDHSGTVKHVFQLEPELEAGLTAYFTKQCEKEVPPEEVPACTQLKLGEFIAMFGGLKK